jgi:hypothetical protein
MRGGHTNAMTRNLLHQGQSSASSSSPMNINPPNILQLTTSSGAMNPPIAMPNNSSNNLNANRFDSFRTRTPNTSRPPSVHVDDYYRMESANAQKQQQQQLIQATPLSQQQIQPQTQAQPQPQQQPNNIQVPIQNVSPLVHVECNKNLITLNPSDISPSNPSVSSLPQQMTNELNLNKNTLGITNTNANNNASPTTTNNNNSNNNSPSASSVNKANNSPSPAQNSSQNINFPVKPIQTVNSQNQIQHQQSHSVGNTMQPLSIRSNNFDNSKNMNAGNNNNIVKNELLPTPNNTNNINVIKNSVHENLIQIDLNNSFPKISGNKIFFFSELDLHLILGKSF